jgi:hypothetical protein
MPVTVEDFQRALAVLTPPMSSPVGPPPTTTATLQTPLTTAAAEDVRVLAVRKLVSHTVTVPHDSDAPAVAGSAGRSDSESKAVSRAVREGPPRVTIITPLSTTATASDEISALWNVVLAALREAPASTWSDSESPHDQMQGESHRSSLCWADSECLLAELSDKTATPGAPSPGRSALAALWPGTVRETGAVVDDGITVQCGRAQWGSYEVETVTRSLQQKRRRLHWPMPPAREQQQWKKQQQQRKQPPSPLPTKVTVPDDADVMMVELQSAGTQPTLSLRKHNCRRWAASLPQCLTLASCIDSTGLTAPSLNPAGTPAPALAGLEFMNPLRLDLRRQWGSSPPLPGTSRAVRVDPSTPEYAFAAARFNETIRGGGVLVKVAQWSERRTRDSWRRSRRVHGRW